jgi:hypothetical protein
VDVRGKIGGELGGCCVIALVPERSKELNVDEFDLYQSTRQTELDSSLYSTAIRLGVQAQFVESVTNGFA